MKHEPLSKRLKAVGLTLAMANQMVSTAATYHCVCNADDHEWNKYFGKLLGVKLYVKDWSKKWTRPHTCLVCGCSGLMDSLVDRPSRGPSRG